MSIEGEKLAFLSDAMAWPNPHGLGGPRIDSKNEELKALVSALADGANVIGARPEEADPDRVNQSIRSVAFSLMACIEAGLKEGDDSQLLLLWEIAHDAARITGEKVVARNPLALGLTKSRAVPLADEDNANVPNFSHMLKLWAEWRGKHKAPTIIPRGAKSGGPKWNPKSPDNREVLRLFRKMNSYRSSWYMKSDLGDSSFSLDKVPRLHPIVKAIIELEPLDDSSWESWHEVGKIILKDEGSGATNHLKMAWKRFAIFEHCDPLTS